MSLPSCRRRLPPLISPHNQLSLTQQEKYLMPHSRSPSPPIEMSLSPPTGWNLSAPLTLWKKILNSFKNVCTWTHVLFEFHVLISAILSLVPILEFNYFGVEGYISNGACIIFNLSRGTQNVLILLLNCSRLVLFQFQLLCLLCPHTGIQLFWSGGIHQQWGLHHLKPILAQRTVSSFFGSQFET